VVRTPEGATVVQLLRSQSAPLSEEDAAATIESRLRAERRERVAERELLVETGYVAAEWKRLGVIHSAIAYTDEAIDLFVARQLEHVGRKLDAGEFLETLIVPFAEAIAMVRDGRISDAKTVAALLLVKELG
jgi:8-oxo-dGTP pyrophosphatase MutT (NUDIX family)